MFAPGRAWLHSRGTRERNLLTVRASDLGHRQTFSGRQSASVADPGLAGKVLAPPGPLIATASGVPGASSGLPVLLILTAASQSGLAWQQCPGDRKGLSMTDQLVPATAGDGQAGPVTARARATRAERMSHPLARDVVRTVAVEHGACIRPVQLRRISTATGERELVMVPCGATLATVCPSCADRAKALRAQQCREGWHLEDEPAAAPGPPDEYQ
jgi:hypothetical protein